MTNLKPAILSPLPGIKILIVGRQWDQKTSDERFEPSQINFHVCFSARRLESKVTDVIRREKTATAMIPWQNIEMATSADRRVGFGNPRCRLNLMKDAHTITSPSQPLERGGKKELHSEYGEEVSTDTDCYSRVFPREPHAFNHPFWKRCVRTFQGTSQKIYFKPQRQDSTFNAGQMVNQVQREPATLV